MGCNASSEHAANNPSVTYDEVLSVVEQHKKKQLLDTHIIDVRNEGEIKESGSIPTALHIPLDQLEAAMALPEAEFKAKYNITKPSKDSSKLIFSCKGGMRAEKANQSALSLGYKLSTWYPGSYQDWSSKYKAPLPVTVTFEDVKAIVVKKQKGEHVDAIIIDVRDESEIKESGAIPTAINIPLNSVAEALAESPEAFAQKYGTPKPSLESTDVIFSCKGGMRAAKGQQAANALGYKRNATYSGSWVDWSAKWKPE